MAKKGATALVLFGAVAFETCAPLLLATPAHLASVPFGVFGLAFHYGIALLQNIDFVSWWAPAYAFLLADPAAWSAGALFGAPADGLDLASATAATFGAAPLRASLAVAYVCVHVLAVVILRFFPQLEILPLSAFPMFGSPQNLFDRADGVIRGQRRRVRQKAIRRHAAAAVRRA